MPVRRRAPKGSRLSGLQIPILFYGVFRKPESRQQNVKLLLRKPLIRWFAIAVMYLRTAD